MCAVLLCIPLALSAFTHLWNPIGFPSIHVDESHYMRRAMVVLNGHGPQDPYYPYDHPYFGQIFLAGVFAMIGYPSSLDNSSSISSSSPSSSFDSNNNNNNINNNNMLHSIEMLYLVPKVLMGLLAVVDTFLIYKISEYRYNRNVALIASVLFAVMPITWLLRRVYLDSILMPFLLSSILFAVYTKNNSSPPPSSYSYSSSKSSEDKDEDKEKRRNNHNNNTTTITNKNILLVLLSGIFLGLAIFTKVPVVALIPLVGFLIYTNNNNNSSSSRKRRLKTLGLWVIPVIFIPLIWPAYSISIGQFNLWWQGVLHQTDRTVNLTDTDINGSLLKSVGVFYQIDPVLLILGIAGLIFAGAIKRDFLILLWVIPFTIFFVAIGFAQYFYVIPILPAFCIAAARMISDLSGKKIIINISGNKGQGGGGKGEKKRIQQILPFAIISGLGIFGLISTSMLITTNVNSSFFQVYAFVVQHLPQNGGSSDSSNNNNNKVTMLGSHWWVWNTFWIPKYVFHKDLVIIDPRFDPDFKTPIRTEKILFIGDGIFRQKVLSPNIFVHIIIPGSNVTERLVSIQNLYKDSTKIGSFVDNMAVNRYTSVPEINESGTPDRIDIRANYH